MNGKFECVCGSLILNREDNINRHKNTKMHKQFMNRLGELNKAKLNKMVEADGYKELEDTEHEYLDPKDKQYTVDILKGGDILLRLV
jgi:hypothetical protein